MKCFVPALLLASLVLLSSCASDSVSAPGSGSYRGDDADAYSHAYHHGFQDAKRGRDENYERYHYEYNDDTEDAYEEGYAAGYDAGEDQKDASENQREDAYSDGVDAGKADAENGRSPFYQRHERHYLRNTESEFRRGYVKGYNEARDDDDDNDPLEREYGR